MFDRKVTGTERNPAGEHANKAVNPTGGNSHSFLLIELPTSVTGTKPYLTQLCLPSMHDDKEW